MNNLADRSIRLCHAYVKLADKFQKLDVEHMTLRSKIIPLIQALKAYKKVAEQLSQDKQELEEKLNSITLKYEDLKTLEPFLESEFQASLVEAEEQVELVDATMKEMESDLDPDLSALDKELIAEYQNDPEGFAILLSSSLANSTGYTSEKERFLQPIQ